MADCIFCQIIRRQCPAEILVEQDNLIVFKDINPKADVHLLIVPKQHIESLNAITPAEAALMFELLQQPPLLATRLGLSGYRIIFNTGRSAGQEVDHLHCHLLAHCSKKIHSLPGF